MVALDVMVVLVELILDLELIRDNECRKDSDCPITRRSNLSDTSSIQSCSYDTNFSHCIYIHGKHSCQLEETHHDIDPAEVFHYLGIAILSYFNLEVLVKLFALDIKFFKHKLEVFDAIVVITSLVLDITIGGEGARESVSLLILLRLWRITRIFNGITLAVEEREKEKRHKLKHDKDLALKDVDRLQKIVHELKVEIHEWRSRAHVEPTYKGLRHADELQSMIAEEEKKHHTDGKHHGHHHHHHHRHGKNHHGKNHLHGNHMQAPSSDSNHSLNSHGSAQSADKAV
ncbi:voltage-gated hydrogen channel 1-like [Sycon ciliatum]|uniref:voltage-gated hydrogen channel 1-like n=1 Tax=Sycon ciliatum TaxID=27933 RepID=UPI0031F6E641